MTAPASAPGPGETLYVHALLDARIPVPRIRRHAIEIVEVDRLFAAVERIAMAPDISEAALREQHRIVVRLGAAADAILPVRFGTLIDWEELQRIAARRRTVLRTALRRVRGRQQMTVRVFGPVSARGDAAPAATGTDYLLARAASSRPFLSSVARAVRRAVRPLVTLERLDPGRGGVQTTMHHLIRRESVRRYIELVDAAVADADSPLKVAVTGPFPPFAFAPDLWSDRNRDRT
jgi:Gas vesicle synthesis protein GvpL/GvpF